MARRPHEPLRLRRLDLLLPLLLLRQLLGLSLGGEGVEFADGQEQT